MKMRTYACRSPFPSLIRPLLLLLPFLLLGAFPTALLARDFGDQERPYLKQVHERVHPRWDSFLSELRRAGGPYQNPALSTDLVLVIEQDGTVSRLEQPKKSGLKGFDDAPVDVMHDVGRLPPPPPTLRSDDGRTYLRWHFRRQPPGCEEQALIERRLPLPDALPALIAAGRAPDAIARVHEAIQTEPEHRGPLVNTLAQLLVQLGAQSSEAGERQAAAGALAYLPDGEPLLFKLARDTDSTVRRAALTALGLRPLSPGVVPLLKQALSGEERATAARLLHRMQDDSGIAPLREALRAGKQPVEMADALKDLGDTAEALSITLSLLGDNTTYLAGALAARSLGDPATSTPLIKALSGAPEALRQVVMEAFGAIGRKTPPEARKAIFRSVLDPSPAVRARAIAASATLGDHSPGMRYRLIDALGDPSALVRMAANAALVEIGGEASKDELLRGIRDKALEVRVALYQALQAHPFPSAPLLVKRLRDDPEVVQAMTPKEEPDEAALVAEFLSAKDPVARLHAAAAWLSRVHSPVSNAPATRG